MASAVQRNKFRRWVVDTSDANILDLVQETSNEELDDFFSDSVDEINYMIDPPISTTYTVEDFPSFAILKLGVLKQILIGKGVWSARNFVSYSDSGGSFYKSVR